MRSNSNTIKEAIDDLLKAYGLTEKLDEHQLLSSWGKLMGKVIAKHTTGLSIKDKVLFVELDSSVLREELSYAKTKIIKLLNDSIGKEVVKDVILK